MEFPSPSRRGRNAVRSTVYMQLYEGQRTKELAPLMILDFEFLCLDFDFRIIPFVYFPYIQWLFEIKHDVEQINLKHGSVWIRRHNGRVQFTGAGGGFTPGATQYSVPRSTFSAWNECIKQHDPELFEMLYRLPGEVLRGRFKIPDGQLPKLVTKPRKSFYLPKIPYGRPPIYR